jgi:hypothetical protein
VQELQHLEDITLLNLTNLANLSQDVLLIYLHLLEHDAMDKQVEHFPAVYLKRVAPQAISLLRDQRVLDVEGILELNTGRVMVPSS